MQIMVGFSFCFLKRSSSPHPHASMSVEMEETAVKADPFPDRIWTIWPKAAPKQYAEKGVRALSVDAWETLRMDPMRLCSVNIPRMSDPDLMEWMDEISFEREGGVLASVQSGMYALAWD